MLGLLLIALPFLLLFAFGYLRELREQQGGDACDNCDAKGQVFTYIVHQREDQILAELDTGCVHTDLKYRWNAAAREIKLHEGMPNGLPEVIYRVELIPLGDDTRLIMRQIDHLRSVQGAPGREYRHGGNRYAWMMNAFWKQKLGAEPIRYQPDMWS